MLVSEKRPNQRSRSLFGSNRCALIAARTAGHLSMADVDRDKAKDVDRDKIARDKAKDKIARDKAKAASDEERARMLDQIRDGKTSKKLKKTEKGWAFGEGRVMIKADFESRVMCLELGRGGLLQRLQEAEELYELALQKTVPAPAEVPEPKFAPGQSVLQWWAGWFSAQKEPKLHYNKKERPSWYSGEIASPAQWQSEIVYAGVAYTGWVYPTH